MVTAKGEQRRAALVRAAAEIVTSSGRGAVNHRSVAERAAVPLGTTTYYFANLHDLRQAAVDALVTADLARMQANASDLPARRRSAAATARLIVQLLTPDDPNELIAWYERYVHAAREPLLADAARRTNAAAREHVATVLTRSGFRGSVAPEVVLAVVDGAAIGALGAGTDPRSTAARALTTVLTNARST